MMLWAQVFSVSINAFLLHLFLCYQNYYFGFMKYLVFTLIAISMLSCGAENEELDRLETENEKLKKEIQKERGQLPIRK